MVIVVDCASEYAQVRSEQSAKINTDVKLCFMPVSPKKWINCMLLLSACHNDDGHCEFDNN